VPAQVGDPRAQDGVGEQPRAGGLDERRGVAEPGDAPAQTVPRSAAAAPGEHGSAGSDRGG
jgi:hypothetical protein